MTDEFEENGSITVELCAEAMSNISYKFTEEIDIELDELEGMNKDQIWQHLYEEYLVPALWNDINPYIPNIDEIVEAVKALEETK